MISLKYSVMISGTYSDHKITALCLISMFPIVTILYSEASEYIFSPSAYK